MLPIITSNRSILWDSGRPVVSSVDADAATWITRLNAQSAALNSTAQTVHNNLVVAAKLNTWWGKAVLGGLGYGVQAANTVAWDRSALGTFSGTNTYANGYTAFEAAGYLASTVNPSVDGFAGCGVWRDSPSNATNVHDIGASDGTNKNSMSLNTNQAAAVYANDSTNALFTAQTASALYIAHRHTTTTQTVDRTTSSGTTSINTSSIISNVASPNRVIYIGGRNGTGGATPTGGTYRCWLWITQTLTAPELAAMKIDIIAWLLGMGWIT